MSELGAFVAAAAALLFLAVFFISIASVIRPIRKLGFTSRGQALAWVFLAPVCFAIAGSIMGHLSGGSTDTGASSAVEKGAQVMAPVPATPSTPLRSTLPATPVVEPVADRSIQTEPADAVLCGARHVGKALIASKATATCPWAFTVPEVTLTCTAGSYSSVAVETSSLLVEANGQTYALNGIAKKNYPAFDPIWAPDPEWKGMKVNVGPWIDAALALCHLPEVAAASSASDGQRTIANRLPACLSQKDDDVITKLAASRDIPAFEKAVNNRIALGTCRMLRVGEAVYVQDRAWTGQVCLRSPGEESCWWTSSNAVSR
jgi:hypothetical protein